MTNYKVVPINPTYEMTKEAMKYIKNMPTITHDRLETALKAALDVSPDMKNSDYDQIILTGKQLMTLMKAERKYTIEKIRESTNKAYHGSIKELDDSSYTEGFNAGLCHLSVEIDDIIESNTWERW